MFVENFQIVEIVVVVVAMENFETVAVVVAGLSAVAAVGLGIEQEGSEIGMD